MRLAWLLLASGIILVAQGDQALEDQEGSMRYARASPLRWGKRSSPNQNDILRWGKREVDNDEEHTRERREAPLRWGKRDELLRPARASPLRWGKRSAPYYEEEDDDSRSEEPVSLRWAQMLDELQKRAPLRWGKRAPVRFGKRGPSRFGKRGPSRFGKRMDDDWE